MGLAVSGLGRFPLHCCHIWSTGYTIRERQSGCFGVWDALGWGLVRDGLVALWCSITAERLIRLNQILYPGL